ncbi:Glycosyltransferase involved in cell wall bisynthesis [Oscillospiraceae bacterium]|nr:Glycosyltransferase involved in cell wall bisynthesis [Oscillospiraceae bacterium]
MEAKPLISIVVPVYNVEKYLRECVDSILAQTYHNFELLLVDDGATDSSGEICNEYAESDPRIQVFHKENGGLSDARNYGIDRIKGDYITFIDSDDFVGKEYLDILIRMAEEHKADISAIGTIVFEDDGEIPDCTVSDDIIVETADEAIIDMLLRKNFGLSAWGKLYASDLFDQIRFPAGKIYEDLFTTPYVAKESKKIVFSNSRQYYYRQRSNSIVHSKLSQKDYVIFEGHERLREFMKENKIPNGKDAANCRFMDDLVGIILQRLVYNDNYVSEIKKLLSENKTHVAEGLRNPFLSKGRKSQLRLALLSPRLYKAILTLRNRS